MTTLRPSARAACPAQKTSEATGTEFRAPVLGFQILAACPPLNSSQIRTSPDGSRVVWTEAIGQVMTAPH
jgi:hypothetical protein